MRSIIVYPDKRLRHPAIRVADFTSSAFANEVKDAQEFLSSRNDGIALAANQIGCNYRFFVVLKDSGHPFSGNVIINPSYRVSGKETIVKEEGCLSFPNLKVNVSRPLKIDAIFQNTSGELFEAQLEGWWARVFCHETDHLDGKLFVDESLTMFERTKLAASYNRIKTLKQC